MGNCVSDTEKTDFDANLSRVSFSITFSNSKRNLKNLSWRRGDHIRLNLRREMIITSVLVASRKINPSAMALTRGPHSSPCNLLGTRRQAMLTSAVAKDQRTFLFAMALTIIQLTGEQKDKWLKGRLPLGKSTIFI